ncbi:MAG: hypothetical protein NUW37_01545 [Planctomycetes bacterium]|nr:hypothetical protein [Planctomycetota bacterium]
MRTRFFGVFATLIIFGFSNAVLRAEETEELASEETEETAPEESSEEDEVSDEEWEDLFPEDETATQTPAGSSSALDLSGANPFWSNLNPRITVFGDMTAESVRYNEGKNKWEARTGSEAENFRDTGIDFRSFELDFAAAIDPHADARFIFAVEGEEVGVEEGYATIHRLPFSLDETLRLQVKAGRFLADFGPTAKVHQHDLPQINVPYALTELLGEEGVVRADGFELSSFFGLGGIAVTPSFTLMAPTIGDLEEDDTGIAPEPLLEAEGYHYLAGLGHLSLSYALSDSFTLDIGGSLLYGKNDAHKDSNATSLYQADMMLRWKPDVYRSFILMGEWYWADREHSEFGFSQADIDAGLAADLRWQGGFVFAQYQISREWYVGARFDSTQFFEDTDEWYQARGVYASFYASEFLRFRLGYENVAQPEWKSRDAHIVSLQLTFIIGSHPPEPYWVNR